MSLLKRIFGGGRSRPAGEDAATHLAKELQTSIHEAERLVAAGRHEEALREAESGLKKFPTAARLRGVVLFVKREASNKKILQLKAALETKKDERAYRELVSLFLDLGRIDAALETATRYAQEFAEAPDAHILLGEVHLARYFAELFARDARAAIESLERAVQLNGDGIRAHLQLALLYYAVGALRTSAASLGEVVRLDAANARAATFREELLARAQGEEDLDMLLEEAEESQQLPHDPSVFPGGRRYNIESRGGTLQPKLFAAAAAGIGRKLQVQQLAAVGIGGKPLAVAGDNKEQFVRLACRLDLASRRAGRRMSFGTMRRFMVEGPFGRIVLVPAGNCAVAARAPRSVSGDRIAEGLEVVVTASRGGEEA